MWCRTALEDYNTVIVYFWKKYYFIYIQLWHNNHSFNGHWVNRHQNVSVLNFMDSKEVVKVVMRSRGGGLSALLRFEPPAIVSPPDWIYSVLYAQITRVVFETEAGGGGVRQAVSPTLPFPLSLPSPFPFPLHFRQTSGREGQIQWGEVPRLPPTNTTLQITPN